MSWSVFKPTACLQPVFPGTEFVKLKTLQDPQQELLFRFEHAQVLHYSKQEPSFSLDILCRTYNGALFEILRMLFTYTLFFPVDSISAKIIFVFDAENHLDHALGSMLETAYKHLHVKAVYEEPPPPGTLTSRVRNEGYSRTQWSNFYSDLYSNADFIAIIDSDIEFSFRPIPDKHLFLDWKKPVIHGIVTDQQNWQCVKFMIGKDPVAEFMYIFPFVIKRKHFASMREHVIRTTGCDSFERAWFEMQNRFDTWGQFLIMGNYLFHFHHDEYAWQIVHHTTSSRVFPYIAKHLPLDQNSEFTIRKYWHQLCVQNKQSNGICNNMSPEEVNMAKLVPFTDYWPMPGGTEGYSIDAARTHDSTAPRLYSEVFDEIQHEIIVNLKHPPTI